MRFEDDDLEDYGDDYTEDEAIDEVLSVLGPQVTEDEAVAALERVDYDVDAAIAALKTSSAAKKKSNQAHIQQKPNKSAQPQPQKSKPTAQQSQPTSQASSTFTSKPQGKLQVLAQHRQTQGTTAKEQNKPAGGALARLAQARSAKSTSTNPIVSQLQKPMGLGKARGVINQRNSANVIAQKGLEGPKLRHSPPANDSEAITEPKFDWAFTRVVLKNPSQVSRILGVPGRMVTTTTVSNAVPVASNAAQEFAQASPDEVVKSAQAPAFATPSASNATSKSSAVASGKTVPNTKNAKAGEKAPSADELQKRVENLAIGKPSLAFVVIGHVDAGKSTLMGRLLVDSGAISQKLVDKYARDSAKEGKGSFALAWVMDATTEERQRGVTVDIGEAAFESSRTRFVVVDAPGHRDYVPNMIAGVAQADVAVLVVDASPNAFEAGFSLDGQTKEHAILARGLGIDAVVVAINKLDSQHWSQSRFDDIEAQLSDFLGRQLGFGTLVFVPTSGRDGTNVVRPPSLSSTSEFSWYTGPTLVQALDNAAASHVGSRDEALSAPFRLLVANAFTEKYQSTTTVAGRVMTGILQAGDAVEIVGNDSPAVKVRSIGDDTSQIVAGQVAEFKADFGSGPGADLRPGDVVAAPGSGLVATTTFVARVRLFDISRPVLVGTRMALYMGRVDRSVRVSGILAGLDKHGNPTPKRPRHLGRGSAARVELTLDSQAVLAPPSVCRDLGRFVLRLNGSTVGGGVVETIKTV